MAEAMTYTQYLYSLNNPELIAYMGKLELAVANGDISATQFAETVESLTGKKVIAHRSLYGDIIGYTLEENATVSAANAVSSTSSTVARGTISKPLTTAVTSGGKGTIAPLAGMGTRIATGAAMVGTAAMCVSAGITLGKTIDSVLYNLNPDFWDSHGMSSLNPETWSRITQGDDSLGASLLNVLFDFNPETGEGQAYIDQNALAYFAAYMQSQGAFNSGEYVTNGYIDGQERLPGNISYVKDVCAIPVGTSGNRWRGSIPCFYRGTEPQYVVSDTPNLEVRICWAYYQRTGIRTERTIFAAHEGNVNHIAYIGDTVQGYVTYGILGKQSTTYSVWTDNSSTASAITVPYYSGKVLGKSNNYRDAKSLGWCMCYGEATGGQPVNGIGTQTGATTPDLSSSDVDTVLAELQQQYPDLFSNALSYPVIQDDGSVTNYTYVPVAMPDTFTRTGTQPVSGTASQATPTIDPSLQNKIDELTKILTNPYPQTKSDLDNPTPPGNPTDTGDGSSPVPVAPTGSASSLWAIYHPTQAQIDSFGAWLWSADFIEQIKKIFNDPMQSIIGLHKIYATPVDAGTSTIKVGYLDSEVPSAYITQQYVTIDCGSVNLDEQFGNVFDYSPFTDVQLYLPFIGIVPLNVTDIMRSTISIEYGVDILTGACLAMVSVERDLYESVLYQYSGNCAVQYPISSGSYMGIVAGIISIAGGIAATVATGGGAAPIALGAAGAAMNAHTQVQHSGSFSGNAGAMGGKKPYLIVTRPITKVAEYFESMQGYKTNAYTTIGECDGYIKAKSVHVINVNATDDELNMINDLILTGIII